MIEGEVLSVGAMFKETMPFSSVRSKFLWFYPEKIHSGVTELARSQVNHQIFSGVGRM